jgi:hypothetical protein
MDRVGLYLVSRAPDFATENSRAFGACNVVDWSVPNLREQVGGG